MKDHWIFCLRLVEAAALGGVVGLERELAGKQAGLRTMMLICVGSALLTHVSITLASSSGGDPARIAAQIVTGIGFLGAGAIMRSGHFVHGLTSAATIWVVAGLGMAVGAGLQHDAVLATILILLSLILLGRLEGRWLSQKVVTVRVSFEGRAPDPGTLLLEAVGRRQILWMERGGRDGGAGETTFSWKGAAPEAERLAAAIERTPGLKLESWKVEE